MKKGLYTTLCFCILSACLYAQEPAVRVSAEKQNNNNVDFRYEKQDPGTYTIIFKFNDISNADRPQEVHSVKNTAGTALSLRPKDAALGIGYSFNYRYIRGELKPKINKDFCYLIPYTPGVQTEVAEAGYANQIYFGAQKPADWKSYFFYTKKEETVTACRKGTVVEITDEFETNANIEFTTQRNSIIIEQEDGTLMRYQGFKKGSFLVTLGETVFPNSPLGRNAAFQGNRYGISTFIYYLSSINFESLQSQTLNNPKSLYAIVSPRFLSAEGVCGILENRKTYISYSNKQSITSEMSKRELKKYNEKK